MLRALCAEISRLEPIGTFESEYELFLHELPDQHAIVHAWESREGSGERLPDGRLAGSRTAAQQIIDSFRFNLGRQILGEIRGEEVWSMVKLMESGSGSISTTHAGVGGADDAQAHHLRDGGRPAGQPGPGLDQAGRDHRPRRPHRLRHHPRPGRLGRTQAPLRAESPRRQPRRTAPRLRHHEGVRTASRVRARSPTPSPKTSVRG